MKIKFNMGYWLEHIVQGWWDERQQTGTDPDYKYFDIYEAVNDEYVNDPGWDEYLEDYITINKIAYRNIR